MLPPGSDLRTGEISLVHDMSQVLGSERMRVAVRGLTATVTQSTEFDAVLSNLPNLHRILALTVWSEEPGLSASTIDDIAVSLRSQSDEREVPIWYWSNTTPAGIVRTVRFSPNSTVGIDDLTVWVPSSTDAIAFTPRPYLGAPVVLGGGDSSELALRGNAGAFGAGTFPLNVNVWLAFHVPGPGQVGPASGHPVPSW